MLKHAAASKAVLGDGRCMPLVGLGTFQIPQAETKAATLAALRAGYRHIDTAEGYGNEAAVGEALRESGIPRGDLFITTKVWPGNAAWGQQLKTRDSVVAACEQSLQRLGTAYVDLYLIHAPFASEHRLEQWGALVELQSRGLCTSIGVSNYGIKHLEEIRQAGLPMPAANQLEIHPYCCQARLVQYMEQAQILPIAYSSLAPLADWRSGPSDTINGKSVEQQARDSERPFAAIAATHGVSEAQVLLRWALQRGFPVLPKSTRPERLAENIDLFGFELSQEDVAAINSMDAGTPMSWSGGLDPTAAS